MGFGETYDYLIAPCWVRGKRDASVCAWRKPLRVFFSGFNGTLEPHGGDSTMPAGCALLRPLMEGRGKTRW
jgi:hypothetical protein